MKIPYKVHGEGDNIYQIVPIRNETKSAFFDSPFGNTGLKSISKATPISKAEIDKRIERLQQEIDFLKQFYA